MKYNQHLEPSHSHVHNLICAAYADCKQAKQSGEEKDGVVAITLPNAQIINAFCVMEEHGGGWTVFQRRVDDSVNFNRNWTEYKNGMH